MAAGWLPRRCSTLTAINRSRLGRRSVAPAAAEQQIRQALRGEPLNELELLNLALETTESIALHFMNFATGLFVFVVAAYFAGSALSRLDVGTMVCVFTIFALISGGTAVARASSATVILGALERSRATRGSNQPPAA